MLNTILEHICKLLSVLLHTCAYGMYSFPLTNMYQFLPKLSLYDWAQVTGRKKVESYIPLRLYFKINLMVFCFVREVR